MLYGYREFHFLCFCVKTEDIYENFEKYVEKSLIPQVISQNECYEKEK